METNQMKYMHTQKGFTLVELLVVIGIIAVLSVVVILTLNPAELLRQARDSNRISDLATMKSALSLYLADVATPVLAPTYTTCHISQSPGTVANARCGYLFATSTSGGAITAMTSSTAANYRKVNASGWIPVDLNGISSGAPVGNLPVDPINNSTYYYAYAASSTLTFEIDAARLESTKYTSGSNDVVSTDGGDNGNAYEVGTAPGLAL